MLIKAVPQAAPHMRYTYAPQAMPLRMCGAASSNSAGCAQAQRYNEFMISAI
jgi:hypothetical protein